LPLVVALYVDDVAPETGLPSLFHWILYPGEVFAVSVTPEPSHFVTLPAGLMLAVAVETATAVAADVAGVLQVVPVTV
jgi:hypothetical protein